MGSVCGMEPYSLDSDGAPHTCRPPPPPSPTRRPWVQRSHRSSRGRPTPSSGEATRKSRRECSPRSPSRPMLAMRDPSPPGRGACSTRREPGSCERGGAVGAVASFGLRSVFGIPERAPRHFYVLGSDPLILINMLWHIKLYATAYGPPGRAPRHPPTGEGRRRLMRCLGVSLYCKLASEVRRIQIGCSVNSREKQKTCTRC